MDLCPDTPVTQIVDLDGCSEQQKDDDEDGIKNHVDDCPNTPEGNSSTPLVVRSCNLIRTETA